jgi:flavin-binding protein dodecin
VAPLTEYGLDTRVYKLIEIVGVSEESFAEATRNAIDRASETLRGLGWFQVTELRGLIQDGKVSEYQVALKVGFRLVDANNV